MSNIKQSNPKDAIGSSKLPLHLVPAQVVGRIALAMLEGALKYGAYNYRAIGVRAMIYTDAAQRHITRWQEGEDIDPDSGLNHIDKALASLTVIRDGMLNGKWVDDRPPKVGNTNWVEDYNKEAQEIINRYPNPVEPYTELNKNEKRT